MRVAIVARVSKRDQEADNQLAQLRAWCASAGHEVVGEYVDHVSGGKGVEKRPEFARMFEDASRHRFGLVIFWSLDRFSREGMVKTIGHLQRLASHGVAFHSYMEPYLSSENELVRDILLGVMSALARAERIRISDRTRAGLDRVRRNGTRSGKAIGRPTLDPDIVARIGRLARGGASTYRIGKTLKLDPKTVKKYLPAQPVTSGGSSAGGTPLAA